MTTYLANTPDPVPLVLDLLITHDRFGSSSDLILNGHTTPTNTRHTGRMLTVHVQSPSPLLPFQVTSYYNPVVDASEDQRECLEALRERLTASASTGYLHIVSGDFNASLFPGDRYGYTDPHYRRTLAETDNRFSDFIHHPELLYKWWNTDIRSGLFP